MEAKLTYQRQEAVKVIIRELLDGKYVQEQENVPNYLLTENNQKIYRLNLMATILHKQVQGAITDFILDDGSGQIVLRSFEENRLLDQLKVGAVIMVIGKLRMYNQERYVAPEIVKMINPGWLKVRALEMKERIAAEMEASITHSPAEQELVEEVKEEEFKQNKEKEETEMLPMQKVTQLIKGLDQGEGVMMEEIISKSPVNNTEQLLEKMLESGEIFQNSPGKVKVL